MGVLQKMALASLLAALPLVAQAQDKPLTKIKVGLTRTMIVGATNTAIEKGYFKEAGLDVEVNYLDGSASFVVLMARNELQIVEGGVSASFFNGVKQGLPVRIAMDNVSTPVGHWMVLRADLKDKIKTIADFKGHILGINAPTSISLYEAAKVLESAGVSLKDVTVKTVGFPQMVAAFETKAVDAFPMPSPWSTEIPAMGLGVQWVNIDDVVTPKPFVLSVVMYNTEWAAQNPKVAQGFFTALLRGGRDYCDAYHGGPNRSEIADRIVRSGVGRDVKALETYNWGARSVDGKANAASLDDIQKWYVEQGALPEAQPMDKVLDTKFADAANKALGPFTPANKDSRKPGCR
jgi:NitT/TauT family transport system substrate-binding protein